MAVQVRVRVRLAGWAVLLLAVATAVAAGATGAGGSMAAPRSPSVLRVAATQRHPAACPFRTGPFRVVGSQVLGPGNRPFTPYGITVSGLTYPDYARRVSQDIREMAAAATFWCANTVRVQVAQSALVGPAGDRYSPTFLAAVTAEVRAARRDHLVAVLNDQTENRRDEPNPGTATLAFWSHLAGQYGDDPQVIFDLFNEPRLDTGDTDRDWLLWQHGGWWRHTYYVGMQALVDRVRAATPNLVWVDGPHWADTLAGLRKHLLSGGGIVYTVHHPRGPHDPAAWEQDFGYLVDRHIAPVVDGEWTNYAGARLECWPDAPRAVPRYLRYLQDHRVGMTVWTLARGVLLESNRLDDPDDIRRTWSCTDGIDQGAGALVRGWFHQQNTAPPPQSGPLPDLQR